MKFKEYLMEDVLDAIIDYRGKTPEKSDTGIPTLSAKSVKNNHINYAECYYISEAEYKRFMVRGFPQKGDILLTTEAPMGMVAKLDRADVAIAQRLLTLRGKEGVLDNDYLLYLLQSPYGEGLLKERETGTTVTGIKQAEFRRIIVKLPDITIQKKIGSILSAIDQKITCNTKINDNLYDLLQSIYQLQFGVTSGNAAEGTLSDICRYTKDRIAVSELSLGNYYSTENMLPGKAGFTEATSLPTTPQTTRCNAGDVLVSNIRPYFKKIVLCHSEGGCSTDVLCFAPKAPAYSAYLFCTLYADRFFDFMVAGSKGTKMPRGDKQQITTYPVYIPTESELTAFADFATPILSQIHGNNEENARLEHLRDTLLPKLMSGEIDVSAIDI